MVGISGPAFFRQGRKLIRRFKAHPKLFDALENILSSVRNAYREHDLMDKGGHLGSEMIVNVLNEDKEAPWFAERRKGAP